MVSTGTVLSIRLKDAAQANKLAQELANRAAEAAHIAESNATIAEAEASIAKATALALRRFSLEAEDAAETTDENERAARKAYDAYYKF